MNRAFRKMALVLLSAGMLLFVACASQYGVSAGYDSLVGYDFRPGWFLNPPHDTNYIYGTSMAENTNESLAWQEAEMKARDNLSNQIETWVESSAVNFVKANGNKAATTNFFTQLTQQFTSTKLKEALVSKRYAGTNNRYYVLISYPRTFLENSVNNLARQEAARNPGFPQQMIERIVKDALEKTIPPVPAKDPGLTEQEVRRIAQEEFQARQQSITEAAQVQTANEEKWRRLMGDEGSNGEATRNFLYYGTNQYFEFGKDYYGFTWEPLEIHRSFLPYTAVGVGVNLSLGKYQEENIFRGGATLYAGLVLPFGVGNVFADGIAEVGYNGFGDKGFGFSPGLDIGISIAGFVLRYRGLWIGEEQTIHSIGFSISDHFLSDYDNRGVFSNAAKKWQVILGSFIMGAGIACTGFTSVLAIDEPLWSILSGFGGVLGLAIGIPSLLEEL